MKVDTMLAQADEQNWDGLESEWLKAVGDSSATPDQLLPVIDKVVDAGQNKLAEDMGWAWLSTMKEKHSAQDALRLGRGLLLRLPDGEQLRDEILQLYTETHKEHPKLDTWVDKSGLKGSMSVRRALRFLEVGLRLEEGAYLLDRTDDTAGQIEELDLDEEEAVVKVGRRTKTMPLKDLVADFDVVDEHNFHVMEQMHPEQISDLIEANPLKLAEGIVRSYRNKIDRDEIKLLLVPKHMDTKKWTDFWSKVRAGCKKSEHMRVEGRSPTFLIYDPVGQTAEQEIGATFSDATTPRHWLEIFDNYLREVAHRGTKPDEGFIKKLELTIKSEVQRYQKHGEGGHAFATALVIERIEKEELPIDDSVKGLAGKMLEKADKPVQLVAGIPDARLWPLALDCIERSLPEKWPNVFAELILYAPAGQIDSIIKRIEKEGKGELIKPVIDRAIADPGRYTDAFMWVWKGPSIKTDLNLPAALELLNEALAMCGPARHSQGKAGGQSENEMRARVRAGLSAKGYSRYMGVLKEIDLALAKTLRRQIERAEGLGPSVQGEMLNRLTRAFPDIYVKVEKTMWEDDSVLYFTEQGLRQRESERDDLVNVKMPENARAIGAAAALGDLSENSEYKYALEERDLLRARLAQINSELSIAKVLKPEMIAADHVSVGQKITLKPANGEAPFDIRIMGVGDSDSDTRTYAYQTPIAMQILGAKKGGTVTLAFDGKNEVSYEVTAIESAID